MYTKLRLALDSLMSLESLDLALDILMMIDGHFGAISLPLGHDHRNIRPDRRVFQKEPWHWTHPFSMHLGGAPVDTMPVASAPCVRPPTSSQTRSTTIKVAVEDSAELMPATTMHTMDAAYELPG